MFKKLANDVIQEWKIGNPDKAAGFYKTLPDLKKFWVAIIMFNDDPYMHDQIDKFSEQLEGRNKINMVGMDNHYWPLGTKDSPYK